MEESPAMLDVIATNPYLRSLYILIGSVIIAKIAFFIIDKWMRAITKHTKTNIDDVLLDALERPVYIIIILAGAYHAIIPLPIAAGYIAYIKEGFFIVDVLVVTWILQRLISVAIPRWLHVAKIHEKTPRILSRVANAALYFMGFLVILDHFDVAITPLLTTLGVGGIAVGLALQETLSNFFAGLHLVSDKPINIGDFIELDTAGIGPIAGFVEDIGWRSTKIKTLSDNVIIIPNAKLAQSVILNSSLPVTEMNVNVPCGVSYGMNLEKVEETGLAAARYVQKHAPGLVRTFEPTLRFTSFGDSNIMFNLTIRVKEYSEKGPAAHELIKELKKRFDKERIEISYPVRKIISV